MCRPTVFESFGLSSETAVLRASGIINIIQLLASMPVIFTLDLLGRRPLLLFGSVLPSSSSAAFSFSLGCVADRLIRVR